MWGRRGVKQLRQLLIPRTKGLAPTDSDLEILGLRVLTEGRLPQPKTQHPVGLGDYTIHIDLAYPEVKLGIELDSFGFHSDRETFERDRERDLELSLRGWLILHFTWAMLRYAPDDVVDAVHHHLTNRGYWHVSVR
jgi:very-short-patch-repair endonuclease